MEKFADKMPKPAQLAGEVEQAQKKAQKLEGEILKLRNDLPAVEKRVADLSTALESSRRERQRHSALDENTSTVDKQVEKLTREMESTSDKAAGMSALVSEKTVALKDNSVILRQKKDELAKAEFYALCDRYNEQAAILAETTKQLHERRATISKPPSLTGFSKDEPGSLYAIHRLCPDGTRDKVKKDGRFIPTNELWFWNYEMWRKNS